ncbi:MerR family transcriptional regulator [Paenibacillaceae bacterium]|nr:MerR family transcriptional regulator [Paenibacillaceae bacterium]
MIKKTYSIGSFAKLTSTTGRTLRFYDRKGLLKPSGYNERGHRTYTEEDLFRLHQILTLKYLDYSLEEIGNYLEQNGKDFSASLEMQYELLLKKQEHIQHVVSTLERVREIVKDNRTIDPQLIMLMIHSIQYEEQQKQWLSNRLPDAFVQSIFMSGFSLEEKLQVNREMTMLFNDLLVMSKEGLQPEHPLVQERAASWALVLERLLGEALKELQTSEVGRVLKDLDPKIFPSSFEPEFNNFLREVFTYMGVRHAQPEMPRVGQS